MTHFQPSDIPTVLSFDDVLLVPQFSEINSRKDVSTRTVLARDIELSVPIISSNMDTVTGAAMAIAIANCGGIGFLHRYQTIEAEVAEVRKVKRYRHHIIPNPMQIAPTKIVDEAVRSMDEYEIGGLMVTDESGVLAGIITRRDVASCEGNALVSDVMTARDDMLVGDGSTTPHQAEALMHSRRIEKLPLLDEDGRPSGLIVMKDIRKLHDNPHASMDAHGRLRVGASIGAVGDCFERAEKLIDAGADCIVIDVAHGWATYVIDTLSKLRDAYPDLAIVAGNVATGEAARALWGAGADAVRVGVGSGSICSTRMVSGSGVTLLSSLWDCQQIIKDTGVRLIADGGVRGSNDLVKACAAGAHAAMLGSLLAPAIESPGTVVKRDGQMFKTYQGMASMGAYLNKLSAEGKPEEMAEYYTPEGIESSVPYRGETVAKLVHPLVGGLRSGMTYSGALSLEQLQKRARWVRITESGMGESRTHILTRR